MSESNSSISPAKRMRPAVEPLVFIGLVLFFIWVIQPILNDWIRMPILAVIVLIPIASAVLHGDRLGDLGFRIDNLAASAKEVGWVTLIGGVIVIAIGLAVGRSVEPRTGIARAILLYPFWGLAQQYAMQSFTFRRLRESIDWVPAAAALTGVLFGIAHWPNLALALVTAVGGFFWCLLFQRNPNLITLAISHGWLAVLLRASWPAEWLHNLRIGPTFWTWTP